MIFTDYTVQTSPTSRTSTATRSISNAVQRRPRVHQRHRQHQPLIAFRITPDITRETGAGSSLNGSYTFRLKYAYVQFNLDDWMTRGSWARLGMQQTPWVDFEEGDLSLPVPGHDLLGARRVSLVLGRRCLLPLQLQQELRRSTCRLLQRRELQPVRDEQPEGVRDPRNGPAASAGARCCAACGSPASTTTTPT